MLLQGLGGFFLDSRWLPTSSFLHVEHSPLVFLFLCKILFSFYPSVLVLNPENLVSLEWSDPRASYGIDNIAFPRFHFFLSSFVLHPTYLP